MRTWFDFDTKKWVSDRPKRYWVGIHCIETNEKIFIGDTVSICKYKWNGRRWKEYRKVTTLYDIPGYMLMYDWKMQEELKPILISHN